MTDRAAHLGISARERVQKKPKKGAPLPLTGRRPEGSSGPFLPRGKTTLPLWTEGGWTAEMLRERHAVLGSREFDRCYRQFPLSEEELLWKPEWIEAALEHDLVMPTEIRPESHWAHMRRFGGVDLAIAEAEALKGSFFVIVVIAVDQLGHRWLLALHRARGVTFGEQMSAIKEHYDRYLWEVCGVENNAYQRSVAQFFSEQGQIPVQGIYTGAAQKHDVNVGLPALAVEFEQKRWHIPYGDDRSRRIAEPLLEELRSYPGYGTTDCLMALLFARSMHRQVVVARPRVMVIG